MASERKLDEVSSIPFTIAGGANGLVTVSSTSGFKVKAYVVITATSLPNLTLEVKNVLSQTELFVGPKGSNINSRSDLSSYTTFLNAAIEQPIQDRPAIPVDSQHFATYEQEPTLARRVINVDELGNLIGKNNPLPVSIDGNINVGTVNVKLTHLDNEPNSGDIADSVRVGDGVNELKINSDGSVNSYKMNSLITKRFNEITVVSRDSNSNPLVVQYKYLSSVVQTMNITYDVNGDFLDVVVV